jgi:TRAP-type C4-dicarboxylate transport system permease small subunit
VADGPVNAATPPSRGWLDRGLTAAMAAVLFAMMALTTVDVIGRYFLSLPVPGGFEISQFLLALMIFAALPLITRDDAHITVGLFDSAWRGAAKRVHRIVVAAVNAGTLAFLAWRTWELAGVLARGRRVTGYLEWPYAPIAYAMAALGAIAFAVALAMLWRECRGRAATTPPLRPEV